MRKELGHDATVGVRQVRVGAPCDKGNGVLSEVAHERFIHSPISGVIHRQPVYRLESFNVIGHIDDRKAQHLCRRIPTFNPTLLLEVVRAFQIGEKDLDEHLQGVGVVVVEGRSSDPCPLCQLDNCDLRDRTFRCELNDRPPTSFGRSDDAGIDAVSHRTLPLDHLLASAQTLPPASGPNPLALHQWTWFYTSVNFIQMSNRSKGM